MYFAIAVGTSQKKREKGFTELPNKKKSSNSRMQYFLKLHVSTHSFSSYIIIIFYKKKQSPLELM